MLRHNFKSDDSPSMISRPSIIPPYWQGGDLGGMSLPPPPPQSTPLQGQPQSQQPQSPQQTSLKAKRKRPKFIRKVQCQVQIMLDFLNKEYQKCLKRTKYDLFVARSVEMWPTIISTTGRSPVTAVGRFFAGEFKIYQVFLFSIQKV